MPIYFSILILFGVGLIAGFMNVTAGGGSTLTLPALIFLGLDSATANGTNRIAILLQNVSAVYSFKQENYKQFDVSLKLSLLTLPGSILGALLAIKIGDELFQKILAVVMIGIIISMIIPTKKIVEENKTNKISWQTYVAMIFVGFYGGFIQVGIGFILMASLKYLMKLNLVYINMHKVFIVLIYTIPALLVFIVSKNINWFMGIGLAAGNMIGGWWGAKLSVKKGERFIRMFLMAAIFVIALKLLNVF